MSGSRKSLKKATIFNPRASNQWSKDDSKFGQKMLEKMGWKQGQGVGLNNQGIIENIKVRLKLDNKGLGYQIKEDQWLEVRCDFSHLLSQLSQGVEDEDEAFNKVVFNAYGYHKFTHGKDIAWYKKEDLIGILGKKEIKSDVPENKEFIQSGNMEEYFKSKKIKLESIDSDLPSANNDPKVDNQSNDSTVEPIQKEDTTDLKNKYREKYKMKYLMSSSDKVYGDEFDGRKLDCKKTKSENMPVTKILDRKNMSKAEKIIAKARLLKMIKDKTITHDFEGSNLTAISGYGNVICKITSYDI